MRRSLLWALAATMALTAAALWTTADSPRVVAAIKPRMAEHAAALDSVGIGGSPNSVLSGPPLPAALPRVMLEPAKRDPFSGEPPPPPKVARAAPPPAAPASAAPPPAPRQAPALNLRYMGTLLAPDGRRLVYLARGDSAIAVAVGDQLDEGYVVESLNADGVTLVYAPLNTRVTVPIPPAPGQ